MACDRGIKTSDRPPRANSKYNPGLEALMPDDPNDSKVTRRGFLEAGSTALAAAGTSSVAKFLSPEASAAQGTAQGGDRSTSEPGPVNSPLDSQNPSAGNPPPTDAGGVQTFKYPFAFGHKRLHEGGWSREVTVRELEVS